MWSILQVPVPVRWTQSGHNRMVPVHFAWPPCTYAPAGYLFMRAFAKKKKYNKQQTVELFPSADSVITFPANPIDSIRLECCPNVRLASGRISCCGSFAVCAYMGTSVHRCTRAHTQTPRRPFQKFSFRTLCAQLWYFIFICSNSKTCTKSQRQ